MPTTHYDNYDSDESSYEEDFEFIFTPYVTIDTNINRVFGTGSEFGQSLGINFENIELVDGTLYADPEKEKFKLFSWQRAADMTPAERFERGDDPDVDDAPEFMRRTYFGSDKEYELVAARVPELTDEDGDIVVEATSKSRDVEFGEEEGAVELGDWESHGGDLIDLPNAITWWSGNDDNGPSVSAVTLAETLTHYGEDIINDEEDNFNWLNDTSGDNILRNDLEDRRVRFFVVRKPGEDFKYNLPIVEDLDTGEQVKPDNRSTSGGSGNEDSGSDSAVAEAAAQDSGTYPEPLADFISSGRDLELDGGRAATLLEDMVEDETTSLTWDMVEDNGGEDAIIEQVI